MPWSMSPRAYGCAETQSSLESILAGWSGPEKQLTGNRLCDFKELQSRAVGQNVTFAGVRIKEIQSLKAVGTEIVVNIPGQIIFDCCFAQTCARRPFTSDSIQAIRFQTVIARFLKDSCQVHGQRRILERRLPHCREGEHKWLTGEPDPLFGQVVGHIS